MLNPRTVVGLKLLDLVLDKLNDLMWNGCIQFFFSCYLILTMIGWISTYDLRFGSSFTATENFSSIFGIVLVIFSIIFPVLLVILFKNGYKPI